MPHPTEEQSVAAFLEKHRIATDALITFAIATDGSLLGSSGDVGAIDTRKLAGLVATRPDLRPLLIEHGEITVDDSNEDDPSVHMRVGGRDFMLVTLARSDAMGTKLRASAARTAYEIGLRLDSE